MEQKQYKVRANIIKLSPYMQLEQLKCYWQGLPPVIERRKHSNATYLVENTEATITAEFVTYTQAMRTALSQQRSDDDEGETTNTENK
jgi:hypothetical protein